MKSYNHLFEQVIDEANLKLAMSEAAHGKKKKQRNETQYILNHKDIYVTKLQNILNNGTLRIRKHIPKTIDDGPMHKKRDVIQPDYKYEQIVHHAIIQVLSPIFMRIMYEYSCGSIPGRGNHYGKKYIEKIIQKDPENTKYVLKCDIKKFFDNVNHDKLKYMLDNLIHDTKMNNLIHIIIDSYTKTENRGIPLGYYTSQWFGNFFLTPLDRFIKQTLKIKYYVRFMDDLVLFASSKEQLHEAQYEIQQFLQNTLDLSLNNRWQIFEIAEDKNSHARPLDFMGFKFYRHKTTLRKCILHGIKKKINRVLKKIHITWYDALQLMSRYGWIKHSDSYNIFKQYYTNNKIYITNLKHKISNHQKMLNIATL